MPFDQQAAVAVAADAARFFTEGLRGIVVKAAAEVDAQGLKLVDERKRLEADGKAIEGERKRLEDDVKGLEGERRRLASDRSALEGDRTGLEKERAALEEARRAFNSERTSLNRDRAVLAQERTMFEKQQGELSRAREEFCKERVDFEEVREQAARKRAAAAPPAGAAEDPCEMVVLNLGGEANVTVLLGTLLQCPESRFRSTFSRPREMPRDAEGRIFVDFKPALFVPLLEHLRMRKIEEPSDPTPPPQFASSELEGQFNKMLQFYGLKDWVYRAAMPAQPRPASNGLHPAAAARPAAALPPPAVGTQLQEAAQKVVDAEAKVRETLFAAAPLTAEDADNCEVDTLKAASERTLEAEKIAAIAYAEAKKVLAAKQKDEQAAKQVPGYLADIAKLQERLAAAQQELGKQRKVAVQGERLWKGKLALKEQEAQVRYLEAQTERAAGGRPGAAQSAAGAALARARASLAAALQGAEAHAQGYAAKLSARVDKCQEKLAGLGQPKVSPQQEVAERLSKAEQAVKQAVLLAQPLSAQSSKELEPEKAQEICESVGKAQQAASALIEQARFFLQEKQKQSGGTALNHFLGRINGMKAELEKAKADATNYEHKLVAKVIMQEVEGVVADLESRVEKVKEAVAPMIEERGRCFVVAGMARMISEALDDHRQNAGITREALFMKTGPGAIRGKVPEQDFVTFVGKVPSMCSRPNLAFSMEQRSAIFKQLDRDADGFISKADFMGMFCDRYECVKETILTKQMQVVGGSAGKLQVGDVVELVEDMQSDATTGIVRAQVVVLKTGIKGWVTIRSNSGATYLSALTPYQDYIRDLEQHLGGVPAAAAKALECVNSKNADIQDCKQGPVLQLKGDLGKVKLKIGSAQANYAKLKKQVEDFKRDYATRDAFERRKSAENLERKASSLSIVAGAEPT